MRGAMKSHYEEIARIAGVSLATVYRVMNRRGQANVSAATEERVRHAAGRLGIDRRIHPKSKLLAFLMGNRNVLHPFHSRILAGAETQCIRSEYNLVILSLHYSGSVNWKKLHLPRVFQLGEIVDGFIVVG